MRAGLDHPVAIAGAKLNKKGPAPKRGGAPRSLGSIRLVEIEKLLRQRGLQNAPADHLVVVVHHVLLEFAEPTSAEAIAAAKPLARQQQSELRIHGRDNRIREGYSYGIDPHPPKG